MSYLNRPDVDLEPDDFQPAPKHTQRMSNAELIARLDNVADAIADCDLQPPTRMRHLLTIDVAIARLREPR